MIVVDASVLVTGLADDGPDGDRMRDRLRGQSLTAPHLIDLEVLSAWRRMHRSGQLEDRRLDLAIADLRSMPMERAPHVPLLERCRELAPNLSTYDAAYVALAEVLGAVLVTGDRRLGAAPGVRCSIEVL